MDRLGRHERRERKDLARLGLQGAVVMMATFGAWSLVSRAVDEVRRRRLAQASINRISPHHLDRKFGDATRDIVEEASWESFPASDPPAW